MSTDMTASAFRGEIARLRVRLYKLASTVDTHPAILGAVLNERRRLTPELAHRIAMALADVRRERGDARTP